MSAGLAAFANGLQSLEPVGREFASSLADGAAKRDLSQRLAYIDQVGRYEEMKARAKLAGEGDLDQMREADPVRFNALLSAQGIDPLAGKTYEEFKASAQPMAPELLALRNPNNPKARSSAMGGGTQLPAPGQTQDAYLRTAMSGPGEVDESQLAGSLARIRAAKAMGVDPKSYMEEAELLRGITSDRAGRGEKTFKEKLEALEKVSGREFDEKTAGTKFGRDKEMEGFKQKGRLTEIAAEGTIRERIDDKKEARLSKKEQADRVDVLSKQRAELRKTMDAAIAAKNRIVGGLKSIKGDDNKIAYLQSQGITWKKNDDGEVVADFTGSEIESDIENKRYDLNETDAILAEYRTGMPKASENRGRTPFVTMPAQGIPLPSGNSPLAKAAKRFEFNY